MGGTAAPVARGLTDTSGTIAAHYCGLSLGDGNCWYYFWERVAAAAAREPVRYGHREAMLQAIPRLQPRMAIANALKPWNTRGIAV